MRPDPCLIVLGGFILAGLLLPITADSEDGCSSNAKVHRNTNYDVIQGEEVRIQCPVVFCSLPPPTVVWYKVEEHLTQIKANSSSRRIQIIWEPIYKLEGKSILVFESIHRNNSGLYRCMIEGSVSHNINVQVHDQNITIKTKPKNHTSEATYPDDHSHSWIFMYCGSGIALFVVMVIIISIVSMRRCRVKPKEAQTESQYIAIPVVEHSIQHGSIQPSLSESPIIPPCRRSTKRKTPLRQPVESTASGDDEQLHPSMCQDRNRQRGVATADDSSSVLYVTLNLQQRPAARTPRTEEPPSEYAAIRVK